MAKFIGLLLLSAGFTMASDLQVFPLHPAGYSSYQPGPEHDTTTAKDNLVAGRRVIRLANVSDATLTYYPAAKNAQRSRSAVIVFPGGGYRILAMDLEGTEICEWLNSIGVSAALVKYRVPFAAGAVRHAAPLEDAESALTLVRAHASGWDLDSGKIGVMGFSAGGHLAALLSNSKDHPDFAMLIYPAYLAAEPERIGLAPEFHVSAATPPTFLVQTEDDGVHVENSLVYYGALAKAKVPSEMHLFATGGHGYGLRSTKEAVTGWPKLAQAWLEMRGLLSPSQR